MRTSSIIIFSLQLLLTMCVQGQSQKLKQVQTMNMNWNTLTPEEEQIIVHKGTERPFSGKYVNHNADGVYLCKRCDAPLYLSEDKFDAQCGWPSFDDEIAGAVKRIPDADGIRTEIICNSCEGHLGHVFLNEGFTPKQTRHCVNSLSIKFIPTGNNNLTKAYFASGCFWGTEYFFMKADGVKETNVGFMGGHVENPTYAEVCEKNTGHLETTEVIYDTSVTSYEELIKLFFETHDFTQTNGQGPDIGPQYLSCIFYQTDEEKVMAEKYINLLNEKGYEVATMLKPVSKFWKAEDYHQQCMNTKEQSPTVINTYQFSTIKKHRMFSLGVAKLFVI